jgi:hypothetical protein
MYSASIVERATIVCFRDVHEMGRPFVTNTYPVVDFLYVGSDARSGML